MAEFVGDPYATTRLRNLMNPERPIMSGVVQNQDAYMKGKIAQRYFTDRLPGILSGVMARYGELTGRSHGLVEPYRLEDAEYALCGMGSLVETAMATADWLRERRGLRVGVLGVTVFRPFPAREIVAALTGVRAVAVIERMDNPLAAGNPLATEIKAAFADAAAGGARGAMRIPVIHGASAGLGSRDVRPGDLVAAVDEIAKGGRRSFVLGIPHEAAAPRIEDPDVRPPGAFSMRGHSVGGFGSVATNRVIATLLGDLPFELWVQAYPLYGSEKKGLPTTYYLTVAEERIRTHSELAQVDFVPLNDISAFKLGDPLAGIAAGGTVFVRAWRPTRPGSGRSPDAAKSAIRDKGLRLLALDTVKIARETSTNPALRQRMQGVVLLGIFLRATPFLERRKVGVEQAFAAVETSVRKLFGKRSEAVVQENLRAARRGYDEVMEVLPL
jgi:pyruvate-ferredoxin/flavodoxin oxidoreductase